MQTYLVRFGRTSELARYEWNTLFPQELGEQPAREWGYASLQDDDTAKSRQDILGGVIKISRIIETFQYGESPDLELIIAEHLATAVTSRVTYGLAEWGRDHLPTLSYPEIKKHLKSYSKSARYVEGPRSGLSAAVLQNKEVREIVVAQDSDSIILAETVAFQDIYSWTERDMSREYVDGKKGMLPLKVARMLVNIGLGTLGKSEKVHLYDPFCGTGTILGEALLRGCSVSGSDQDPDSIIGSTKNLTALAEDFDLETPHLLTKEVAQVALRDLQNQVVDLIVTEPFLGKPKPSKSSISGVIEGLRRLYLGAFKRWTKLLADEAVVVMIFPQFSHLPEDDSTARGDFADLIDNLEKFGYTTASPLLWYSRPQAEVKRIIQVFKYVKS